jgi:hypothetical protein
MVKRYQSPFPQVVVATTLMLKRCRKMLEQD